MENKKILKTNESIETIEEEIKFGKLKTKLIESRLMDIFLSVGITANLQGYHYLKDGIKLVMKEPRYISNITKYIYPKIAIKHSTTPYRVERGIRHALEVSYGRGKMIKLNSLFGIEILTEKEKPTNAEFVALIANKLNLELR